MNIKVRVKAELLFMLVLAILVAFAVTFMNLSATAKLKAGFDGHLAQSIRADIAAKKHAK